MEVYTLSVSKFNGSCDLWDSFGAPEDPVRAKQDQLEEISSRMRLTLSCCLVVHLLDKSKELHIDKSPPPQMVDIPIAPPCCVALTNSENTGKNPERCKLLSQNHSSCFKRHKSTLLIGTTTVLLLLSLLKLLLYFTIEHDYNSPVAIQPESRAERIIRLSYPLGRRSLAKLETEGMIDGEPSFNDQSLRASQITRAANDDAFPTINEADVATRYKREISRNRRECKLNEEYCKILLKSMKTYFGTFNGKNSDKAYTFEDLVKCLQCKNLKADIMNEISKDSKSRPYDRYFPHDVEQDRSTDFDTSIVKLLNDELNNGTQIVADDQTETPKIQSAETSSTTETESQSTIEALRSISSETTTVSVDRVTSWGSPQVSVNATAIADMSTINYMQTPRNPNAFKYFQMKLEKTPSNVPADSNADVTDKSKSITNDVLQQFTTSDARTITTQYSIIKGDNAISEETATGSSETETPNYDVDLANQIAITENVTSVPEGYNVTGITDNTVHPSTHPSLEGHSEARSAATNGARSMDGYYPVRGVTLLKQTTNKNTDNHQAIAESTKSFQELQLTPMSWTTQPICFFGYPGQPSNKPLSAGVSPYMGPFVPSAVQDQGFPSQPLFRQTSPPNYMQVQAQTVQFLPRNNAGNQMRAQPTAQGIGPTGPGMLNAPIFPMNQPISQSPHRQEMFQQSGTDAPYFCTYIPIPTYNFPPIPGTSQSSRSSNIDKAEPVKPKNNLQVLPTVTQRNSYFPLQNYYVWKAFMSDSCPEGYRQCKSHVCISQIKWCDGRVDCVDASDETNCSCTNRIWQDRLCDGYVDCPDGEDELNCFNCPENFFNCNDWENPDNCVPLTQRCDGIEQCLNGKDEMSCNILSPMRISENNIFAVGYTEGFLHKNLKGKWYPACSNTSYWAIEACMAETGEPLTMIPQMSYIQVPSNVFQDPYVVEFNNQIEIVSCSGSAIFVKCPPLSCGMRTLPNRDTSVVSETESIMYKRHLERQTSQNMQFHQLYQDTLNLLKRNQTMPDQNKDEKDAFVGSQPRVVGGHMSQPTAWPFLVAIYRDGVFHCGGVILNEVYILTAAHCMISYQNYYFEVEAGVLRRFSFSPTVQLRRAIYIILHPRFDNTLFLNDVALVMLDKPLLFNRWIRPICLPTFSTAGPEWKQGPTPQSICVAVGWGAVTEYGPDPDHLQEVAIPILSTCKHSADQINSTICAGYIHGGHDACQGDSGGPLLCRNPQVESQWYVAGVISHGDGCGRPNEPGVYTKVSYFVDWIQEVFKLGNSVSFYAYAHLQSLSKCSGFSCLSGSKRCLPITTHCDGIIDCLHGEDEINCQQISEKYKSNSNNETVQLSIINKSAEEAPSTPANNLESSEDTPIFSTLYDIMNAMDDSEDSSIANDDVKMLNSRTDSVRLTFTCNRLIQTITIDKRCDRHLDCEDGSDEDDCTCRDYLVNLQPLAICDGHLDCMDETDEKDCGICNNKFHCSKSGKCISTEKRCDANYNCYLGEDEKDCFALTDGEYVNLDYNNRSASVMEGFLSRYYNGVWDIQCLEQEMLENNNTLSIIGRNICTYLGFANLESVEKIAIHKRILETRQWGNNAISYTKSSNFVDETELESCEALWIHCRPVLSSSAETYLIVDPRTGSHNYLWPWLAAIFIDGRYHCSALLLEPDWLLSSASCTDNIKLSVNYTTALLGQSRSFLHVDGPYQQVSVIDEIRDVSKSNLSLLHLKTAVNFTRYVQPLFLGKKIYPPAENDLCVAVGTNKKHVTESIFLQPVLDNCDKCHRCFAKSNEFTCPINGTVSDWSGTVFCRGERGWYPAATFHEEALCTFGNTRNWTSIDYIHAYLTQALEEELYPTSEATCDGIRCNLGQCIPWNRVCDGLTDCRDGADEESEMCNNRHKIRSNEIAHGCTVSQLKCGNGQCISKGKFCDGVVDCSDGTDEPLTCTCAEYLRLTAPNRLCDGVWHCLDKSDESPEECNCTETSFKCNATEIDSICLPQDFVCDGNEDCPNGKDEEECIKVKESANDKPGIGEVMQRSYGVWHSWCFTAPVTKSKEAKTICQELGYVDGSILHDNRTVSEPLVPSRDDFYMVRINPETWVTMRTDKPLINLVQPGKACHRLFVSCS